MQYDATISPKVREARVRNLVQLVMGLASYSHDIHFAKHGKKLIRPVLYRDLLK